MKKPEGLAEAGWYDHPTEDGYEKFWNGKFWSKKNRLVGEEGPLVIPQGEKYLGRFLFRSPIGSDGLFIAYIVTLAISVFFTLKNELAFTIDTFTILAALFSCLIFVLYIYLLFLLILIPRRIFDKRKGRTRMPSVSETINSEVDLSLSDNPRGSRHSRNAIALFVGIGVLVIFFVLSNNTLGKSEGDKFFEEEQRISSIMGEWNQEVAKLVTLIQGISSGQIGIGEAQERATTLNSQLGPILIRLNEECSDVPNEPISGQGQERAIQLSWKMLSVACEVIPQQYTETLAIYKAQISETSTQTDIDYHVAQLNSLGERKKSAAIEALQAMEPYANSGELENIKRMKVLLGL